MKREDELHTPMSAVHWHVGLGSSLSFKNWALGCYLVRQKNPSFLELPPFFSPISFLKHIQPSPELFYSPSMPLLPNSESLTPSPRSGMGWRVRPFPLDLCSVETAQQTSVRAPLFCPDGISLSITKCKKDTNIFLSPKDDPSEQSVWLSHL